MSQNDLIPYRQIRAVFDATTIRVYQAYNPAIADAAVQAQRLVSPFKRSRTTWLKPSFTWMMGRSGCATKTDQQRVLAIDLTRDGFESALARACLSHFDRRVYASEAAWREAMAQSPVRVQWDPERDALLHELEHRSLQVGLTGSTIGQYVDRWTVRITDVTALAHRFGAAVAEGDASAAAPLVPAEQPYPLPEAIAARIGASR